MAIRFYHGTILTFSEGNEMVQGELWTEHDRILYVGSGENAPPRPQFEREIDLEGGLLMPGLKNAHTHSGMTFLRGAAGDLALQNWLHTVIFPAEAKLTAQDVRCFIQLAILEYLAGGTTACFDMYLFPQQMAEAAAEMGFRTVLCGQLNDFVSSAEQLEEDYLRFNQFHPLVSHRLGFHAEYTTGKENLKKVAMLSQKYSAPVYTHLAETAQETQDCIQKTGKTPLQYLDTLGMWEYGGGIFHGVYLNQDDMTLCRKKQIGVVSNPGSNAKLASGIAPLEELAAKKVLLGLGTDGAASNDALDMFREMYLAAVLQKLRGKKAAALPAKTAAEMAVKGGAQIMGLSDCDCLEKGEKADLIWIDTRCSPLCTAASVWEGLVYTAGQKQVRLTMIDGKILYENGAYANHIDAEAIYARAAERIQRYR